MDIRLILTFVNLLCAGILAGMEIMIHYGLRGATEGLDDRSQLQLRKALVLRIRVLVPAFFLSTLLTEIMIAVLQGAAPGLWLRVVGLLAMLIWIIIRIIGTVPINSATLDWDLAAPPQDWKAQIAHAERFHDVGVWAVVLSFACFLVTAAVTLTPS
jgi:hypothetical protein